MSHRPAVIAAVLPLLAVLVSCSSASPAPSSSPTPPVSTTGNPSGSATATLTADDVEAGVPAFPADTSAQESAPSQDTALVVTDISTSQIGDLDRVTLTLQGQGTPGWRVTYVEAPVDDPADTPVAVEGQAFLAATLSGTTYPSADGPAEVGIGPVPDSTVGQVTQVVYQGTFEAQSQAFIGLTAPDRLFRVYALTDPTRVVIDIQH